MSNIFLLQKDFLEHTYRHGRYQAFNINDPKPRNIHKASVCDRLLHRAVYRILYPFFSRVFIVDSFFCQICKGTHKAINRFRKFVYKVSRNNTMTLLGIKMRYKKIFCQH